MASWPDDDVARIQGFQEIFRPHGSIDKSTRQGDENDLERMVRRCLTMHKARAIAPPRANNFGMKHSVSS